jgi:hypothetical protein
MPALLGFQVHKCSDVLADLSIVGIPHLGFGKSRNSDSEQVCKNIIAFIYLKPENTWHLTMKVASVHQN